MQALESLKRDAHAFAELPPPKEAVGKLVERALEDAERQSKALKRRKRSQWVGGALAVAVVTLGVWFASAGRGAVPSITPETLSPPEPVTVQREPVVSEEPAASRAEARTPPQSLSGDSRRDAQDRPATPRASRTRETPTPKWRALADTGRFAEAVEAAKRAGLEPLLAGGSAGDLLALGEAANYSGDSATASQVFSALRKRHIHTEEAGVATFHLARQAASEGQSQRAIDLLDVYLRRPGGLSREARGLRLELLARSSDPRAAEAARSYLKTHSNGPHSTLAQTVLESAP